jgi:predicted transcriptional regulator
MKTNFQKIIKNFYRMGYTQTQLAELCDTTQPNIRRIGNGQEPRYFLGERILKVHNQREEQ